MEPLEIIHVVITVVTGGEKWQGDAFYEQPQDGSGWIGFFGQLQDGLAGSLPGLIDVNGPYSFGVQAERYTLHGPMACSMRRSLSRIKAGEAPPIKWVPVMEIRFTLPGGKSYG